MIPPPFKPSHMTMPATPPTSTKSSPQPNQSNHDIHIITTHPTLKFHPCSTNAHTSPPSSLRERAPRELSVDVLLNDSCNVPSLTGSDLLLKFRVIEYSPRSPDLPAGLPRIWKLYRELREAVTEHRQTQRWRMRGKVWHDEGFTAKFCSLVAATQFSLTTISNNTHSPGSCLQMPDI